MWLHLGRFTIEGLSLHVVGYKDFLLASSHSQCHEMNGTIGVTLAALLDLQQGSLSHSCGIAVSKTLLQSSELGAWGRAQGALPSARRDTQRGHPGWPGSDC